MASIASLFATAGVAALVAWLAASHWFGRKLRASAGHLKAYREGFQQLEVRLKEAKQQIGTLKTALAVLPTGSATVRPAKAPLPAADEVKDSLTARLEVATDGEAAQPPQGFADTMPFADDGR